MFVKIVAPQTATNGAAVLLRAEYPELQGSRGK